MFCDICKKSISKSNTTHKNTDTHTNKIVEKHEVNPFDSSSISEFKTIVTSTKPQFIKAKVSIIKKTKTEFSAQLSLMTF